MKLSDSLFYAASTARLTCRACLSHAVGSLSFARNSVLETVTAGELEGSWLAGGQQEGLQYNGKAAG